jgi:uncharacterized protein (DUF433 family)
VCGGKPRIAGHRIKVQHIAIWHEQMGMSPAAIVAEHPDDDFLRLHAAGVPHAGIAYCHQQARTLGEIIQGLVLIWNVYESAEMVNRVEYL